MTQSDRHTGTDRQTTTGKTICPPDYVCQCHARTKDVVERRNVSSIGASRVFTKLAMAKIKLLPKF